METENNTKRNTKEEIAKGVYFGALIGDSIGSKLEFKCNVTTEQVEEAWEMLGGGCHGVGPGQITDDGELAICLGAGIINGKGILNLDEIAIQYGKWFQSPPFGDIIILNFRYWKYMQTVSWKINRCST